LTGIAAQRRLRARMLQACAYRTRSELSFTECYVVLEHPTSHFHIGHHSENRWPVERKVSPEAFGLMVLKLYYSGAWASADEQVYGDVTASMDKILIAAKQNCGLAPGNHFSALEKQQFYFA
jgi:hypothetical protein